MYPREFDYIRAGTVDEALSALASGSETVPIAGGHGLLPAMKAGEAAPDRVVDVSGIDDLCKIEPREESLCIGAAVTHARICTSAAVAEYAPPLAAGAAAIGDRQVRNVGTIGGNLAEADPSADLPGAAIAADASVVLAGPDGRRTVAVDEFFREDGSTAIGPDELLTRVEVPLRDGVVGAYARRPQPATGVAVAVAAVLVLDGHTVAAASVGANGVRENAIRLGAVEDSLEGQPLTDERIATAAHATDAVDPSSMRTTVDASPAFRAHLLREYTERALDAAADRAGVADGI
jgi:carbon-monoxide dehydrogenase medium subunit